MSKIASELAMNPVLGERLFLNLINSSGSYRFIKIPRWTMAPSMGREVTDLPIVCCGE